MKNFLKLAFALCVDLCAIIALSSMFVIIFDNALGMGIQSSIIDMENPEKTGKNLITTAIIVFIIYVLTSIICKTSVGLLIRNKPGRTKAWRMFGSAMVDFYFVYTISLLVNYGLLRICYVEFFGLFLVCLVIYGLLATGFGGKTIGRYLLGINILHKNTTSKKDWIQQFLFKCAILIAVPYLICLMLGVFDGYAIFLNITFFNFAILIFSLLILKKPLCSKIFKTQVEIREQQKLNVALNFVVFLFFVICSFLTIKTLNNSIHKNEEPILGFNFPYEFPKYPKGVESYLDVLKSQEQSPKDYILSLFERYDIVILQEKYHGEFTQWEMIEDIVKDSVFVHQVGHVFTEYGSAMHQHKIDQFLQTTFENDTLLEQETAVLMYYMSGGFYYFKKNLNLFNATLPDAQKIQLHYTDCIDWDYFSDFGRVDVEDDLNRDSLMADVVIAWYNNQIANNQRHKLLLITNYRHAFGYAGGIEKVKNTKTFQRLTKGNQAQYIWEQFPDKTATVMQPDLSPKRTFFLPFYTNSHKGIWDKAFALNSYKPVGFDLKNTPFGNTNFDQYPLRGGRTKLSYSDLFTGIIFNKPYMDLREKRHPFRKFAVEEEARRKGITDTAAIQRKTAYLNDEANETDGMFWALRISLSNFIPLFVFLLFSVFSALVLLGYSLKILTKRKR